MAAAFIPDRLRRVVGRDAWHLTEDDLRKLLAFPESEELEFKREPCWSGDAEKRDLAADVAGLANRRGGLLIVGIDEGGDGVAAALTPAPGLVADDEELKIRQTVASRCAPVPPLDVVEISGEGGSYLVLSVPPSPLRPHAVMHNNGLRYPIRDGAGKRYLSESEVAASYRDRFSLAEGQVGLAKTRHAAIVDQLRLDDVAWLTVAVQPTRTGEGELSRARAGSLDAQIQSRISGFPSWHGRSQMYVRGGFRCYRFRDGYEAPYTRLGELHMDGGGVVAHGWNFRGDGPAADGNEPIQVGDEDVVAAAINSAHLLAWWAAEECGAGGDAIVLAQLHAPADGAVLWQYRTTFRDRLSGATQLVGPTPVAEMTTDLAELSVGGAGLLIAARSIAQDLMGGFEFVEPLQIDQAGRLRVRYFYRDRHDPIRTWASANDAEVTDDTVNEG